MTLIDGEVAFGYVPAGSSATSIDTVTIRRDRRIPLDEGALEWHFTGASGAAAFVYHLRFPGQYYDDETGLHYNYFRDYDPVTGRYVQSDPIGLVGGLNTYLYGEANPLRYSDPLGLQTGAEALPGAVPSAVSEAAAAGARAAAAACRLHPVLCAASIGFGGGTLIYPHIEPALSRAIDWMCRDGEEEDRRELTRRCQALKDSILNTCYGLTGRKRMACFEAANTAFRQCMGWE